MYFLSFVIFFLLYVIIIIYHLTTLCVHDIFPFMFSSFSFSISYSCFMKTPIHFAFPILFLFHAYYIWHSIYLYSMMLMYSHIIRVFLSLNESILLRNWNHSNWIIQTKVMAFSCQSSQFTDFTRGTVFNTHFPVS